MPRTEAWWVCGTCNKPVKKVGKNKGKNKAQVGAYNGHRDICPGTCYSIHQLDQKLVKRMLSE